MEWGAGSGCSPLSARFAQFWEPVVGTCCGPGGIGAGDQTKQGSECETASLSVYPGLFIEPDCLPGLLLEGFQGVLSSAVGRELAGLGLEDLLVEGLGVGFVVPLIAAFRDKEIGLAKLEFFHFFVGGFGNKGDQILFRKFAAEEEDQLVDPVTIFFRTIGADGGNVCDGVSLSVHDQ